MIQKWLEEIFIRKFTLNIVKLLVSYFISHLVAINGHLSVAGITISANPEKLMDFMNGLAFVGMHELHVYIAAKYPELGKYL